MQKLQTGVIGCGRISVVYAQAFRALEHQMEVKVACDKDMTRAQDFAAQFPGCVAVDTIEDFLTQKPQVAHILTPHFLHKAQAIACLEAGIDVLTEKPIAITLPDADAMVETMERTGRQLGVIFQNRWIDGIAEAKRMLDAGELGTVTGAWSTLNWHRPPSYYQCDWKGSWEKEGGGVVIDQAIHSIDLVRYLIGSPVTMVHARIDRRVLTSIEVEDVADAAITFKNGAVYSFYACNYYTSNSDIRVEISCEKGNILLVGSTVSITQGDTKRVIAPKALQTQGESYWGSFHLSQIRAFYGGLTSGGKTAVHPADARETLAVVLGIYSSARTGRPHIME